MNDRTEIAKAALTGLLSYGGYDLMKHAAEDAFNAADEMLALSAPDALEALKGFVEAIEGNPDIHGYEAMETAKAVLARYEENKG